MKYYMIEIPYETNSGEYSYKKIFTSEKEMNEWLEEYLKSNCLTMDDFIDTKNEWTGRGPNWETLHVWQSEDDDVIIVMVIDNDKEE